MWSVSNRSGGARGRHIQVLRRALDMFQVVLKVLQGELEITCQRHRAHHTWVHTGGRCLFATTSSSWMLYRGATAP